MTDLITPQLPRSGRTISPHETTGATAPPGGPAFQEFFPEAEMQAFGPAQMGTSALPAEALPDGSNSPESVHDAQVSCDPEPCCADRAVPAETPGLGVRGDGVAALRTFLDVRFGAKAVHQRTDQNSDPPAIKDLSAFPGAETAALDEANIRPAGGVAHQFAAPSAPSGLVVHGPEPNMLHTGGASSHSQPRPMAVLSTAVPSSQVGPGTPLPGPRRGGATGADAPAPMFEKQPAHNGAGFLTGSPVSVSVQSSASGIDLVMRLGPLAQDDRARLKDEIAALLAAHGLRINTVEIVAPSPASSQKEET